MKLMIAIVLAIILTFAGVGLIVYKDKITTWSKGEKTTKIDDDSDDDYEIDSQPPNSTKKLSDTKTLENILNYQGLNKNPNRLAVGVLSNDNNSHINYFNIANVLGNDFNLDLFLELDSLNPDFSPFLSNATIDPFDDLSDNSIDAKYNIFSIKQDLDAKAIFSSKSWIRHYIYFNNIIYATHLPNVYSTVINDNTYFYVVFEIKKLNKVNSFDLNYTLNIVLTLVRKKDEKELKQKFKNAIYVSIVEEETGYPNYKKKVKYTNKIIKTGDHNSFRDKNNPLDKRNIKYMLLYINKD